MPPDDTLLVYLKSYLRIDHDYEDALLTLLMDAGKEYLTNAGVPAADGPLYRLALMLYVSVHYETRDGAAKMEKLSYALESVILQLKIPSVAGDTE